MDAAGIADFRRRTVARTAVVRLPPLCLQAQGSARDRSLEGVHRTVDVLGPPGGRVECRGREKRETAGFGACGRGREWIGSAVGLGTALVRHAEMEDRIGRVEQTPEIVDQSCRHILAIGPCVLGVRLALLAVQPGTIGECNRVVETGKRGAVDHDAAVVVEEVTVEDILCQRPLHEVALQVQQRLLHAELRLELPESQPHAREMLILEIAQRSLAGLGGGTGRIAAGEIAFDVEREVLEENHLNAEPHASHAEGIGQRRIRAVAAVVELCATRQTHRPVAAGIFEEHAIGEAGTDRLLVELLLGGIELFAGFLRLGTDIGQLAARYWRSWCLRLRLHLRFGLGLHRCRRRVCLGLRRLALRTFGGHLELERFQFPGHLLHHRLDFAQAGFGFGFLCVSGFAQQCRERQRHRGPSKPGRSTPNDFRCGSRVRPGRRANEPLSGRCIFHDITLAEAVEIYKSIQRQCRNMFMRDS